MSEPENTKIQIPQTLYDCPIAFSSGDGSS